MKPRVLITGASGFVGYHLVEAALDAGMEVYAAVRASSNVSHLNHLQVNYVYPDFSRKEALTELMKEHRFDYIIHGAGITKARSLDEYNKVNAGYTQNLAQAVSESGIPLKKFLFISSLAAVGPIAYDASWPVPDVTTPSPVTSYGKSKLLAEEFLGAISDVPWVILRPTAVYGPRERDLFVLFKTFRRGLEPYMGRGAQWLSFVYVKDLADAAILALKAPVSGVAYNISDGNSYDRYALAAIIKQHLKLRTLRIHLPLPVIKIVAAISEKVSRGAPLLNKDKLNELTAANWNCNIDSIRRDLGYQPRYNLEKGMQETLDWYSANKWF
ncbi:Nucleoside-diphosphate-sugar epimerase [Chitinophaga sp. YR627]|uniref:NAD-dependent epimerase/dehydratase family protein n=1 Tax=Chitinophaga sp. YR627 TaxID=1881041 RepID=UPI0008F1C7B6|nr:NAD-dependent epimerase/dehydratase family protein [Chitinophaga sp. YR627]SFN25006.1 Nucleoside-diphosphate-sugar epimerase [Chitinophaga sp. YR627]